MLLDVLFIFCKLNRDIGYRQGMHEVVAPILWAISRDAIDPESLDASSLNTATSNELAIDCLSAQYVEHDTFILFSIVMQTVKSFYELGNHDQSATSPAPNGSPIVERSRRIHEQYLRAADLELAEHLTAIEVLPQIFLIRWIRLLFGREFPFEDLLCLWDALFAEDPTLDLVDLVCVSMLLRIRWQCKPADTQAILKGRLTHLLVIEADYSAALTLLLRYPPPVQPNGPPSFIADAIYLRENPLPDGGAHIISKYSTHIPLHPADDSTGLRVFSKRSMKKGRKVKGRPTKSRKPASSNATPVKFLKDQGGVEGIIQEAARGIYTRGEKWGVTKALRGAVQGLQSGSGAATRLAEGLRSSLDDAKNVADNPEHLLAKIRAFEQRNQGLARLLENAMEELWVQQRRYSKEGTDDAADLLSIAIAKVQFVQVYLENSTMPLPSDAATLVPANRPESALSAPATTGEETTETSNAVTTTLEPEVAPRDSPAPMDGASMSASSSPVAQPDPTSPPEQPTTSVDPSALAIAVPNQLGLSPFHQSRPSLAHSSFSWMLGEDRRQSSFVSASPFPSEKRLAKGKAGFLFGDDNEDSTVSAPVSKGRKAPAQPVEETITLGLLHSLTDDG